MKGSLERNFDREDIPEVLSTVPGNFEEVGLHRFNPYTSKVEEPSETMLYIIFAQSKKQRASRAAGTKIFSEVSRRSCEMASPTNHHNKQHARSPTSHPLVNNPEGHNLHQKSTMGPKPCRFYFSEDGCWRGDACYYSHVRPDTTWMKTDTGDLVHSITTVDRHEDPVTYNVECEFICSYNWIDSDSSAIFVPGTFCTSMFTQIVSRSNR